MDTATHRLHEPGTGSGGRARCLSGLATHPKLSLCNGGNVQVGVLVRSFHRDVDEAASKQTLALSESDAAGHLGGLESDNMEDTSEGGQHMAIAGEW